MASSVPTSELSLSGMNFQLSEEHLMIRDMAREFAETELKPGVIDRDEKQYFPKELLQRMGELGFLGMMVSEEYGGGGMDTVAYVLAMEEISKWDASASVIMSVNNSLVCWGVEKYGNEEQKRKYLPKLCSGETIGAFCLSEPEAGSDATRQKTIAEDRGDHYVLNGTKNWITNGGIAGVYLVMAQTDVEKAHKGINCLNIRFIHIYDFSKFWYYSRINSTSSQQKTDNLYTHHSLLYRCFLPFHSPIFPIHPVFSFPMPSPEFCHNPV